MAIWQNTILADEFERSKKHLLIRMNQPNYSLYLPSQFFFATGYGDEKFALNSFDGALAMGGIGNVNVIRLSSTLNPKAMRVLPFRLPSGSFVGVAYAVTFSEVPGQLISAAVILVRPVDPNVEGVIMENGGPYSEKIAIANATEMAHCAMKSRGVSDFSIEVASTEYSAVQVGCCIAGLVQV